MDDDLEAVWKALADPTRREILDSLRHGPRTTSELVSAFPHLSRFAVMKHLTILCDAGLVLTRREGRYRYNALNAVPIRRIYERWVKNFEDLWATGLLRIRDRAEAEPEQPK